MLVPPLLGQRYESSWDNTVLSWFGRSAAILAAPVPAGSRRYDPNQDSTDNTVSLTVVIT